jgi:hypothetical protein
MAETHPAETHPDPAQHPDLAWDPRGQSTLSGALLALLQRLDAVFLGLARECAAREVRFPPFLAARHLERVNYFRSFPQHATFPVHLEQAHENLRAFADQDALDAEGRVRLTRTVAPAEVLTPAACYHVYPHLAGEELRSARFVTLLATCFRREAEYRPLRRQWAFSMREIVCLGSLPEVEAFLARTRGRVQELVERWELPGEWQQATDPFFDPKRNPKHLAQRLDPVKHELVFGGDLAISSVNLHRNYFGETFGITRAGEPASSGCVAFGLERWLHAILASFGPAPEDWPGPLAGGAA